MRTWPKGWIPSLSFPGGFIGSVERCRRDIFPCVSSCGNGDPCGKRLLYQRRTLPYQRLRVVHQGSFYKFLDHYPPMFVMSLQTCATVPTVERCPPLRSPPMVDVLYSLVD